jgi:hypothetical protein
VPYYNVPIKDQVAPPAVEDLTFRDIMEAFASRFVFLLMSIDEMGIQYFSGVNNDTMDSTLYHFNYFVSLVTGIFDALALETRDSLQLTFEGDKIPARTSLSKKSGDDFLKALRNKSPDLANHINANADFISLIHRLRESVVHREGLQNTGFEYRDDDARWRANFLTISKDVFGMVQRCGDRVAPYQVTSQWGVHAQGTNYFLSPYVFAREGANTLARFSNDFLKLLGSKEFVKTLQPEDDFVGTMKAFESGNLGF